MSPERHREDGRSDLTCRVSGPSQWRWWCSSMPVFAKCRGAMSVLTCSSSSLASLSPDSSSGGQQAAAPWGWRTSTHAGPVGSYRWPPWSSWPPWPRRISSSGISLVAGWPSMPVGHRCSWPTSTPSALGRTTSMPAVRSLRSSSSGHSRWRSSSIWSSLFCWLGRCCWVGVIDSNTDWCSSSGPSSLPHSLSRCFRPPGRRPWRICHPSLGHGSLALVVSASFWPHGHNVGREAWRRLPDGSVCAAFSQPPVASTRRPHIPGCRHSSRWELRPSWCSRDPLSFDPAQNGCFAGGRCSGVVPSRIRCTCGTGRCW